MDSGVDSGDDGGIDAGMDATADSSVDAGVDSGVDSTVDSAVDAGADTGPILGFGSDCTPGTVYMDPFNTDPRVTGDWAVLAGSYTFNAANHTVTLNGIGGSNVQMWIGPRPSWVNYTVSTSISIADANGNAGVNVHIVDVPNPAPNDSGHMYFAGILGTSALGGGELIGAEVGGSGTLWQKEALTPFTFTPGQTYPVTVTVKGTTVTIEAFGAPPLTYTDTVYNLAAGSIGIRTYNSTATFGPITVTCN
jgi:hypothetical protein